MRYTVCIPMYNESAVIADCAKRLSDYLSGTYEDYEILFVDDGSTDESAKVVESLGLPHVRVIRYEKNRGKGYAVRTGLSASTGDFTMFTDADLAYGTDVIGRVFTKFEEEPDAQIVVGSRNLGKDGYEGYSFIRKVASKLYILVLNLAGGLKLSDSQCGCKAFTKQAVEQIIPRCEVDRFAFDFEIILWAQKLGIRIAEIPVKVISQGASKVRLVRDSLRMLRDLRKMKKKIKKAAV